MFWKEVWDVLLAFCSERLPFIRHNFHIEECTAIGNILGSRVLDINHFPIKISSAFIIYCLFGGFSNDIIYRLFLEFLLKTGRGVVNAALKGFLTSVYEDKEFTDVLERFNCRSRVFPLNVYGINIYVYASTTETLTEIVLDYINMVARARRLKTAPFV